MKKKSNWMWSILIIIAIACSAWFLFGKNNAKDIEYRFDDVKMGDISIVVTATGTVNAVTTIQVGSQVSGTIAKLYADYNTVVKAGDVVAQLDPTFLEAAVKESQANLERANAQMNDSKRTLDRDSELIKKGMVSQAEFDAARTAYESAIASVKQNQATLDRAQVNLKFATIRAPIDGVVISRNVDVGQTVAASFSAPVLFIIANDLTKMQVEANIDEADIGRINLGQNVSFTVDAYPDEKFRGRVAVIRLQPNNVQNVINYTVVIDVPNPDLKLMPGMTANVTVLIDRKNNVLRVPNLALRFSPPNLSDDEKKKLFSQQNNSSGQNDSSKQNASNSSAGEKRYRDNEGSQKQNMNHQQEKMGSGKDPWKEGKEADFTAFNRQLMLASKNLDNSGKQPKALNEKWERIVNTYQRKEFPGRVWIMDKDKKLKSIVLRLGMSDGIYTEVVSGDVKDGDKIIVGSIVKNDTQAQQTNPFSQQRQMPGGGRRM